MFTCPVPRAAVITQGRQPSKQWRRLCTTMAAKEASIPALTSNPETATWDPEGLLSSTPLPGGHFDRRDRKQKLPVVQSGPESEAAYPKPGSSQEVKDQRRSHIESIAAEHAKRGGIPAAERDQYDHAKLSNSLADSFVPVNLDYGGVCIQHLSPPVLTVDNFMTPAQCEQLAQFTEQTGLLQQSKIGEGSVDSAAAAINARRTSSTLLLNPDVIQQHANLEPLVLALQSQAQQLLPLGRWSAPGQLPPPGQYCFESLQVARYQPGQHFLEHEDAFPPSFVQQNKFQRQATLLLYLNDVEEGGTTHFDQLNLSIKPQCGKALLFFPASSDGTPDPRTTHTAQSPSSTKWVSQVWITGGHPVKGHVQPQQQHSAASQQASHSAAVSRPASSVDEDVEGRVLSRRRKKGSKATKQKPVSKSKGFA